MRTREIRIKTITPMLSHGADGKTPEIRIPEFKAAMRFWWRALGNFRGVQDMRKKEGIIFGDSEKNASPFVIQLKDSMSITKDMKKKYVYNIEGFELKEHQNINLLFKLRYPNILNPEKNEDITEEMNLNWSFDNYIELFNLVSILGAIGGKSRKGYGSFYIDESNNKFKFPEQVIERIKSLLTKCNMTDFIVDKKNFIKRKEKPKFKDYPYVEEIYIGKTHEKEKFFNKICDFVSHNHPNKYKPRKVRRYACPIWASCVRADDNLVLPVITVLKNTCKEDKYYENYKKKFLQLFISGGDK